MSFLAPVLVLGIVILVHELGHFWAAKLFGVYAPRFAIGFGPTLWRRRWGETEYVLGALPLGGYVRMATRDDEATAALEGQLDESKGGKSEPLDLDAMIPFGPKPVPAERWFESKPLWQRAIILLAGVTMNVVLALFVMIATVAVYARTPGPPVIGEVVAGRAADRGGLLVGDSVIAIDSTRVSDFRELANAISAAPGRAIAIQIERGGERRTLSITTDVDSAQEVTGEWVKLGLLGVRPDSNAGVRLSARRSVLVGTRVTWAMASNVVTVLKGLVTGRISVKNLGGPARIVQASIQQARAGFEQLLTLIAFLSVNLAILNLVPIPLLDGGQLLLQTAETVKGSPFSDRTREWIARVGLAAIATLFIVVTFNDLKALIAGWIG
ncbi:MAG TPA: site-2 protease family protein [Gemmatimonadaceae bacterium]|nr:site-2 protease family protein [Gemmatimonadaceae bacterium]